MRVFTILLTLLLYQAGWAASELPDTGISGVYEVMVGTDDAGPLLKHFAEFGFSVVREAEFSAAEAQALYGVSVKLRSLRLQNGGIDSHGLLRILEWGDAVSDGVGYAPPETIGQRMSVIRTRDIIRLHDIFMDARRQGERWFSIEPIFDDLYDMSDKKPGIIERRIGVRESAVYGELFNHVFFQRYGYTIPGYGSIGDSSPLQASEFTHHDFIIKGDIGEVTAYYSSALGLKAENEPVLSGDWQPGPQRVFDMGPGKSHWYIGFVSPNNICGKLKFFVPADMATAPDRSARQRIGAKGITLHSLYTPKLNYVHTLVSDYGIKVSPILNNEFGEKAFVFVGPDGASWQIIEKRKTENKPVTEFKLVEVDN